MKIKQVIPVKDSLFEWTDESCHLIVSKCSICGELVFPRQDYCPECCEESMEKSFLASNGILKCYTGISAVTPGYKGEVPYTVGIVEFAEGIRVLGLTTEKTVESLSPNMKVEVVIDTAFIEGETEYITYKYRPLP